MKVLLLEHPRQIPPDRCNDIANCPLSSCLLSGYIAGLLQDRGHEAEIIEGYLDQLSYPEIERLITAASPTLLGVHMVYHWQGDRELFSLLERLKRDNIVSRIAVYGYYPTFFYEQILNSCCAIDGAVLGEPELTFEELTAVVAAGRETGEVSGLAVRDGGGGVRYTRRPLLNDLDRLPFPVRTGGMFKLPEVNIQGSRGCYGACTFCYINPFYGQGSHWRGRSPANITAEIDQIVERYGRKEFYFTDPNFFGPGEHGQRRVLELATLLKERGIRFGIEGRVNDVRDETIAALVDAGLSNILIGMESGRDESLRRMNKMTTVAQNERALQVLRQHGIRPNIGFIMFEPDSTLDDVRLNLEFLERNRLLEDLSITANLLYHHQIILSGTPAFQRLAAEGRLQVGEVGYEGTVLYQHEKVACLAGIMRRLTNFLFTSLSGVWSGRSIPPDDAPRRYRQLNDLLVGRFEAALSVLQSGEMFGAAEEDVFAQEAEREMGEILKGWPGLQAAPGERPASVPGACL
jgi:radical SAM superfamily enzyme YgiQ (UPF0313 family)